MKETLQILDELLDEDDKQAVLDVLHHVSVREANIFVKRLSELQQSRLLDWKRF